MITLFGAFSIAELWALIITWLEVNLPIIVPTIAAVLPSLGSIIGIICAVAKLFKDNKEQIKPILEKFDDLRQEVRDKTELREARAEMKQIIHDNAVLKRQLNELLTLQSKVKHEVPTDETK